jgi:hypothetical protein
MVTCYATAYAQGRSDAIADAPESLRDLVSDVLSGCFRLDVSIDLRKFEERLKQRGVSPELARQIAVSADITDDHAYFSSRSA